MTTEAAAKPKQERSPSFPFISLKKATERAEALFNAHKREAARIQAVATTWGYAPKSSGLLQTVAALKQYGLLEDTGSGEERKVQLSPLGRRLLMDSRPGAREQALKEAARSPRLIAEYLPKWVPDRPSDAHCLSELALDRGFTQDSAEVFLRVFDETVAFSNLALDDNLSPSQEETMREDADQATAARAEAPINVPGAGALNQVFAGPPRQRIGAAILPLPEGTVSFEIPAVLSEDSLEDVKAWVAVLLARAERMSKKGHG